MPEARRVSDLSGVELAVRSAAKALARRGVEPSAERVAAELPSLPGPDVRAAWNTLARDGFRFPAAVPSGGKAFNVALWRIVHGKGSLYDALAAVTGLTANAVKCRVDFAGHTYPSAELDGHEHALTPVESQYFSKYYGRWEDPDVRDLVGSFNTARRRKPDARSAKDNDRRTA